MPAKIWAISFLFIATIIWGISYPIGRAALEELTPWAYGGLRFFFGSLSLLPLAMRRRRIPSPAAYAGNDPPTLWLKAGFLSGLCLSIGGVLQLYGLSQVPASQAGFITTLYVSMVPILAFVTGYLPRLLVVVGLGVGLAGLYLLTGSQAGGLGKSEVMLLVADVFWALQVIITGYFAIRVNTWLFSLAQAVTGCVLVLSLAVLGGFMPSWSLFFHTLPFTMWGIMSVGVAYTCQAIAQKEITPTSAALIFPLQSVIGAAAGFFFLGEYMNGKMILGAAVIVAGCVIAQFARESVLIVPEHPHFKALRLARLAVAVLMGLGTIGGFIWSVV